MAVTRSRGRHRVQSRGSRGGLLEVPILGHGDLDRLRHDVCPVGAAAEVLRVVVDLSDELDRKTEGHSLELDCRLRVNATFGHGLLPRSCLLRLVASRKGKVCAATAASWTAEVGEVLQGITAELSEPAGGGSLNIERALLRLSELRATRQRRRSFLGRLELEVPQGDGT